MPRDGGHASLGAAAAARRPAGQLKVGRAGGASGDRGAAKHQAALTPAQTVERKGKEDFRPNQTGLRLLLAPVRTLCLFWSWRKSSAS